MTGGAHPDQVANLSQSFVKRCCSEIICKFKKETKANTHKEKAVLGIYLRYTYWSFSVKVSTELGLNLTTSDGCSHPAPHNNKLDQILQEFSPLWHPFLLYLHPHSSAPHTCSPLLSQCGVHTSWFSIPATKPQQQGGNGPATTAVMMESVGGLAGSLTLPNKSPNNSVNIRLTWPPDQTHSRMIGHLTRHSAAS